MIVERKMMHDIVDMIPETDIPKVYAIVNAYLSLDREDILTEEQQARMREGFAQIERGEYVTASDYIKNRGLA